MCDNLRRFYFSTAILLFFPFVALAQVVTPDTVRVIGTQEVVRIAIMPFQNTGFVNDEADYMWGAAARTLLTEMLALHPRLTVNDRAKTPEVLEAIMLNKYGTSIELSHATVVGGDYVILGEYFMNKKQEFLSLDLRLVAVDNASILARHHINHTSLHVSQLPTFLEQFATKITQELVIEPLQSVSRILPCKRKGLPLLAQASFYRDQALLADNPTEALEKYHQAFRSYEKSLSFFCNHPRWVQEALSDIQQLAQSLETNIIQN